jgi:hypothetical protein
VAETYFFFLSWVMMLPFVYSLASITLFSVVWIRLHHLKMQDFYKVTLKASTLVMFFFGMIAFVYLLAYYNVQGAV